MTMLNWAKREIELAKKKERETVGGVGIEEGIMFDYGGACLDSALKAFETLLGGEHSGLSFGMTRSILGNLMNGRPLTPIEDTDDIWNHISDTGGENLYQCSRMSSLFKTVGKNGDISYHDNDSLYCVDVNTGVTYNNGLVFRIFKELYPITMPYVPTEPIKVYCEDFLTDSSNGDFDTVGILYMILPDGTKMLIDKYFKEEVKDKWVEIEAKEYTERIHLSRILKGENI